MQVIPVPRSITADVVAETFIGEGKRLGIDFDFADVDNSTGPGDRGYFKVDLPDGRRMVHWLKDGVPFGVQFGRRVSFHLDR